MKTVNHDQGQFLARNKRKLSLLIGAMSVAAGLAMPSIAPAADAPKRPNILLIVADDMGYSDIGAFGGEINTPNIDALAARGSTFTNFYAAPTSSPTRSMLLTGTDNHVAGLGNMDEMMGAGQRGKPGYEGHLNERVVTVASVLRDAGYHTYMAGKWHLGETSPNRPAERGFERDFTLMQGGGSNWSDMGYPSPAHPHLTYMRNGQVIDKLPDDHFSSAAFSDFIIQSVDEQKADGKPFFGYLSFQAVHSPFAVPDDWLDRYKGKYDKGYDVLRAERLARMKKMGLVGKDVTGFPRLPIIPAWDKLTPKQRQDSARKMEVYAAMLSNMDHHIGRVLDHLRASGQLDNTLVIFISDNGPEAMELVELAAKLDPAMKTWLEKNWDTRPESCGRKLAVCDYGPAWAQVGAVPFRAFKGQVAEGGIRVPLIVAGPGVKHKGDVSHAVLHVTDLVPTVLEVAGATHPSQQAGSKLAPITGKSWMPMLGGDVKAVRTEQDWIGWEMFGNRAVRQGDWKLLYLLKAAGGPGEWQLFNLRNDPAELRDQSKEQPERVKAMLALWDEYVKTNGVMLTNDGPFASGK
jgi:arylsulfatase